MVRALKEITTMPDSRATGSPHLCGLGGAMRDPPMQSTCQVEPAALTAPVDRAITRRGLKTLTLGDQQPNFCSTLYVCRRKDRIQSEISNLARVLLTRWDSEVLFPKIVMPSGNQT